MSKNDIEWNIAIADRHSAPPRFWRRALKRGCRLSFFDSPQHLVDATELDPEHQGTDQPHLMIIDWDGVDGQAGELVHRLRIEHNNGLGVIAVVDEDDPEAAQEACEAGCNEYITRPLDGFELSTRVINLLRHQPKNLSLPEHYPPFQFDVNRRTIGYDGHIYRPRPREFDLMLFLFRRADQTITRSQIKECVWFGESDDCRSIDTYISRLRRSYGLNGQSGWAIKSVYGTGYRLLTSAGQNASKKVGG